MAVLYDRFDGVLQAGATRTRRARSRAARTESRCLALLFPVACSRRVGHPAADRGSRGSAVGTRAMVRRTAHRGRGAAVGRVGARAPRDARAPSDHAHRAARDRARVRHRLAVARRDRRRRHRRSRPSVPSRRPRRVRSSRRATTSRRPPRTRSRLRRRVSAYPLARAARAVPRPAPRLARLARGRGPSSRRCSCSPTGWCSGGVAAARGRGLVFACSPIARPALSPLGGARARRVRDGRPADPGRPRAVPARARRHLSALPAVSRPAPASTPTPRPPAGRVAGSIALRLDGEVDITLAAARRAPRSDHRDHGAARWPARREHLLALAARRADFPCADSRGQRLRPDALLSGEATAEQHSPS